MAGIRTRPPARSHPPTPRPPLTHIYTHTHTVIHTRLHTYIHTYIHTHTHRDTHIHTQITQADRQTDRQTDRDRQRQTDRQTDRQTHIHTYTQTQQGMLGSESNRNDPCYCMQARTLPRDCPLLCQCMLQELRYDYGMSPEAVQSADGAARHQPCLCGSSICRGLIY